MIMADQVFTVPFEYPSQDGKSTINAKMWTKKQKADLVNALFEIEP